MKGLNGVLTAGCLLLFIHASIAPPPRHTNKDQHETKEKEIESVESVGLEGLGIEYERYLKEVVEVLESDPEFKRKLEDAKETDIRSGQIAHELEYVDHNVRSKLDEVKRAELERLRHLAQRDYEINNNIDVEHMKITPPEHLDHDNPHTFEINDLKKLIHKVTNDLNEVDKKRRTEFKEYEMQKEFENQERLKHLEGAEKETFEKQLKENETKHKQHDPLHHPGSKAQLEEVWEKQDHMKDQEFNPKVFFQLHDLDGNGYWDQNEVKALFVKELDKMYEAGVPEDDMRERAEELERMREHVFKEADKNGDQLINFKEFSEQTKQPEFEKDPQWEGIDQKQPVYSRDEYLEFERRRQEEVQRMIQQGLIPPQPVYNYPPGYHPQMQQQFHQGGYHPQQQMQQQYHQQQMNQAHNQQVPPGHLPQVQPGQFQQAHPGQPAQQQQFNPNAHPAQFNPNAHPAQFNPNAHPAQFNPNAHPAQYDPNAHPAQFNPNAHPAQYDPNAIPPAQYQAQQNNQPPQNAQQKVNAVPPAPPSSPPQYQANSPSVPSQPIQVPQDNKVPNQAAPAPIQPQASINTNPEQAAREPPHNQNFQNQPNPPKFSQEEPHQGFNVNIAAHKNQQNVGNIAPRPNDAHPNSIGGSQHKY